MMIKSHLIQSINNTDSNNAKFQQVNYYTTIWTIIWKIQIFQSWVLIVFKYFYKIK